MTSVAPTMRFCSSAAATAELGISMNCTVFESPPFASIHACVATAMRSLSDDADTVLPLRSRTLVMFASFATTKPAIGYESR